MKKPHPARRRTGAHPLDAQKLWRLYGARIPLVPADRFLHNLHTREKSVSMARWSELSREIFSYVRTGYLSAFLHWLHTGHRLDPAGVHRLDVPAMLSLLELFDSRWNTPADLQRSVTGVPARTVAYISRQHTSRRPLPAPDVHPTVVAAMSRLHHLMNQSADMRLIMAWNGVPVRLLSLIIRRAEASHWSLDDTRTFIRRLSQPAPMWIRLRDSEAMEAVVLELKRNSFCVTRQGDAWQVAGTHSLYSTEAFSQGLFEIQDYASQAIGQTLEVRPGEIIWDCCAGSGGKSLQIAAALKGQGSVYATDRQLRKLEDLKQRTRRASLRDIVRVDFWDGETIPQFGRDVSNRQGFDAVLVDAPCSASGTWRRNPDARLRLSETDLPPLQALQTKLLTNAATMVRPGGRLVYATCSICVEENESVTGTFLQAHPQFRLSRQSILGNPAADADTMFASLLLRDSL